MTTSSISSAEIVVAAFPLRAIEEVVDASGAASAVEARIAGGGRPRQLSARTLLVGICLALCDHRPAHLTRIHEALVSLSDDDRLRLGVVATWRCGPHLLTYRQVERTSRLVTTALSKDVPDGRPSAQLREVVDSLVEASIPKRWKDASGSLAVDWSDIESHSRPPEEKGGVCADSEASWGRRKSDQPGVKDELFFGYELQAATMVKEECGEPMPELVRRILLTTCSVDPPKAFVPVLEDMVASGTKVTDVCSDSGYAHRRAEHWSLPLRALGAEIVTDLHPNDRGPRGTFMGAVASNGNLYCPAAPRSLLELGPLGRQVSADETAAHDVKTEELSRYKLGRLSHADADGYHRVMCPAVMGKLRCPLREESMSLSNERPEVLSPPDSPPPCCCQQTLTVGPEVHAKTAQKHAYPSKEHRRSYARRTAVERTFSTVKDPATNDVRRGWCRMTGIAPVMLMLACVFVVRNDRVIRAFEERQADGARRIAKGLAPKTRKRRRKTIGDLLALEAKVPPAAC